MSHYTRESQGVRGRKKTERKKGIKVDSKTKYSTLTKWLVTWSRDWLLLMIYLAFYLYTKILRAKRTNAYLLLVTLSNSIWEFKAFRKTRETEKMGELEREWIEQINWKWEKKNWMWWKKKAEKRTGYVIWTEHGEREQRRRENNCGRHFILSRFNNAR